MWCWAAAVVLGLASWGPACEASLLGAVVTLEPLIMGKEVRAHTSVLAPEPCPSLQDIVCEGTNCVTHMTSDPISGQYPAPGWCLRQWQSVVPFNHTSHQALGGTDVILSSWAGLSVRPDNMRLNQPPIAALLPPLRVSVNCLQKFYLSVLDLDGDRVRCRYGDAERKECLSCFRHKFLQLDEENCVLVYDGLGEAGQYIVELMVEDFLRNEVNGMSNALSSTPLQLSITVEGASADCQALPTFTGRTPERGTKFTILPYEELDITVETQSPSEMISEIAVVGPPGLLMAELRKEESGSFASINLAWLRNPSDLPQLLSICFTANTQSLQSEIRCVWIKQKTIDSSPPGTVLQCRDGTMTFSFPISSVPDLVLSDLKLNNPSCPISYNNTHVMGDIPLQGCGTKLEQSGSELVYTNTLQTLLPDSPIIRAPTLVLRLSCRFPAARIGGPHFKMSPTNEEEVFGVPEFWLEFFPPGLGPESGVTQSPIVQRTDKIDLYIFSNTSVARAELQVSSCVQSPTMEFKTTQSFLNAGCVENDVLPQDHEESHRVAVFRLDLSKMNIQHDIMYVRCQVVLCVALRPSESCQSLCRNLQRKAVQPALYTKEYTVTSDPLHLEGRAITIPISTTTSVPILLLLNRARPESSFLVVGVAMGVVRMLFQTLLL
ncbi:hypothetical protein COCON_G00213300 [Conger conger]|uniref:ZP domain-containing protein n=1 Tax=Conger conger TaxID=82655 RepID=A0A9Q1HP46_CONCO|nr:hypothetical protein COCON_G00213300 [Conger conger]